MAISARSRRGTSSSFWRNHNAMQTMLVHACMPSIRSMSTAKPSSAVPQQVSIPRPLPTTKFFVAQA